MTQGFWRLATRTIHTAHIGLSKLLYPFHPLFGKEMEVFGAAGSERDLVYIRLPNNTTRGLPAWMFDEAICAGVRSAERPTIDCRALLRLTQLLDSLKPDAHSAGHEPSIISTQNNSSTPSGTGPAWSDVGTNAVKQINAEHVPDQVSAPLARVAPVGRSQRKTRKRRLP